MDKIKITKVSDTKSSVQGNSSSHEMQVDKVQALSKGGCAFTGTLHLTSHHLIYSCVQTAQPPGGNPKDFIKGMREIWITYHIIAHCTFRPSAAGSGYPSSIRLRGRDFSFITFNFKDLQQAREVFESIRSLTCRLGRIEKLYAFSYQGSREEKALEVNGWNLYDPRAEWKRQGISDKGLDLGWRISTINHDYEFSSTYPQLLVVPTSISDNVLNYAGKYRSKVRIPALTYLHPINNCSITRSAQPRAGLRNNRSVQDEKLVSACFSATASKESGSLTPMVKPSPSGSQVDLAEYVNDGDLSDTERLEDEMIAAATEGDTSLGQQHIYGAQQHNLIVDARPTVNALAMQAVGLGSENMDNYKFAAKAYLGIENIHVMRESLAKVIEAVKDADLTPLPPNRELLAKSGWLKHITGILDGAALITRQVGIHHSHVLIHCSDGWDRTSQLSALSQILLDPYYRTLDGFIVLVEKDWLAFGHMFQHRNGYLNSEKWFVTQTDGLAGTSIQPGGNDTRNEALENALAKTKRFFSKRQPTDEVDSDGEPVYRDESPSGKLHGHSKAEGEATKDKETSPVFHQFLDAVYQLVRQYPTRFEFNERFLRRLLYHVYSCQYGTFLYNSEKARLDANVQERTRSVWDYFLCRRQEFTNPQYDGGEIDDHIRGRERLIFPHLDKVRWWNELFNRSDEEMNGPSNPVTERYLGPRTESGNGGILYGVETASANLAVNGSRPSSSNLNPTPLGGLRESISNLSIGKGKGGSGSRNPGHTSQMPMEVEMQ
jgi:myotubularin-related protein 6/7/8